LRLSRLRDENAGAASADRGNRAGAAILQAQAWQAGGDLPLAAPRKLVRRLLDLTGLIGVFAVHASVDKAVLAAGGSRPWLPPGNQRRVPGGSPGG
jgi:hypothetical protein